MRRALAIYAVAAVVLLGLGTGVLGHPETRTVGVEQFDFSQFVWYLAWWPRAVLGGHNPLVTTFLFAPDGYNLTWATSVPALAAVSSPLTLLADPVVAFNVLALAGPVVAATAAFALCRHLTAAGDHRRGEDAPAIAGGFVFGFSPFVMANEQASALNLIYVALIPAAILLVLRRLEHGLTTRRFVGLVAVLAAVQFLVFPEILATAAVLGAAALIGASVLLRDRREELIALTRELLLGGAIGAVIVSPWLYEMFARPHLTPAFGHATGYSSDLVSFVVPSPLQLLGGSTFTSLSGRLSGGPLPGQHGFAYLGLPLLAIVALAVFPGLRHRTRDRRLRLIVACTALAAIASIGPSLQLAGHHILPFPWALAGHVPLLRYAVPDRFAAYTALGAGVTLAIWVAQRPTAARWALAGAAIVVLLPNPSRFGERLTEPAAYRDGRIAHVLHAGDAVFALPPYGETMRWQAETGMAYRLAGGYTGAFPEDYLQLYCRLGDPRTRPAVVARFLRDHRVTAVLVASSQQEELTRLGIRPTIVTRVGDQVVARLAPPPGPAPPSPLATHGGSYADCARLIALP